MKTHTYVILEYLQLIPFAMHALGDMPIVSTSYSSEFVYLRAVPQHYV